jgi:hypothetical protein
MKIKRFLHEDDGSVAVEYLVLDGRALAGVWVDGCDVGIVWAWGTYFGWS